MVEEHKNLHAGSDEQTPGSNTREIAAISDAALDDQTMAMLVGESTVAGWFKNKQFPDYAKRATLAAYSAGKHFDAAQQDGKRYLIVTFDTVEAGVSLGRIIARDLPNETTALVLSGSLRVWELLGRAEHLIDSEIETQDAGDSHWLKNLKDEITTERNRTFAHDKNLERIKQQRQREEEFAARACPLSVASLLGIPMIFGF